MGSAYWGHDLDLSRSRDIIGNVTTDQSIRHMPFPIGVPLEPNLALSLTVFEIFDPKPVHTHT